MNKTIDLAPTLSDRMALAAGSGREELLPSDEMVREHVAGSDPATHAECLVGWINIAADLCRTSMDWRRLAASRLVQAEELTAAVILWAETPGDHGGNPYCKPFVRLARTIDEEMRG